MLFFKWICQEVYSPAPKQKKQQHIKYIAPLQIHELSDMEVLLVPQTIKPKTCGLNLWYPSKHLEWPLKNKKNIETLKLSKF